MKLFSLLLMAFTLSAAQAKCLDHQQIMNGIRGFAQTYGAQAEGITEDSPIYSALGSNPVAAWEDLDNYPTFRRCDLTLGPNDLRFVQTVGELAGVINHDLKSKR